MSECANKNKNFLKERVSCGTTISREEILVEVQGTEDGDEGILDCTALLSRSNPPTVNHSNWITIVSKHAETEQ